MNWTELNFNFIVLSCLSCFFTLSIYLRDLHWLFCIAVVVHFNSVYYSTVCAKLLQSWWILCNPMNYSPPGSSVHGILQSIKEWVAMPSFKESSQPGDQTQVSHIAGGFFTVWATKKLQEYWSGWPIPSPADLPDPGIELGSPELQEDSWPAELQRSWETKHSTAEHFNDNS